MSRPKNVEMLRANMTRAEVVATLGPPDATGGTSRKQKLPIVYKYGDVQVHFGPGGDCLFFVHELGERTDRAAIVFDGSAWFIRQIRTITHDFEYDHKVYRCDEHLGGPFESVDDAVKAFKELSR